MSDEELAVWLRAAITARLELAREASPKTDGHWWRRTASNGEPVSHLWAGEAIRDEDGDVWSGEYVVVYDEGAPGEAQFDHMTMNDPRDTIARCEAELAILDEHASDGDVTDPQCVRCADTHPDRCECGWQSGGGEHWRTAQSWPCRTVRLLASGYRHRPGYREEWAPTPG